MKKYICTSVILIFILTLNGFAQQMDSTQSSIIEFLLKKRTELDTLFTKNELNEISEIQTSLENSLTEHQIVTKTLNNRALYTSMLEILNKYKKILKHSSENLYSTCIETYSKGQELENLKETKRKVKYMTSPLPFLLFVDNKFIHLLTIN